MNFLGLDYSSSLSDPAGFARAAKAAGYTFVVRYLAPLPNQKVLTAAELAALHAAGLGVGLVSEKGYGKAALGGAAQGSIDGPEARAQATALGFPPDHPIFGAVDFDPTPDQLPTIAAYLGAAGFEPYGNGAVCTYCLAHGFSHFWLMDWGGHDFADPHIHQQGGQVDFRGENPDFVERPPTWGRGRDGREGFPGREPRTSLSVSGLVDGRRDARRDFRGENPGLR